MSTVPVITIDGASGTGKGTLGRYLAHWLGWHFLDSGALYRVLAVAAEKSHVSCDDVTELASLAQSLNVSFEQRQHDEGAVFLDGDDVSDLIRTEIAGNQASKIAILPKVRDALVERQRQFRRPPGLVADGRDMGTRIFVDATLKIYLEAAAEERVKRRYKQLKQKGFNVNIAELEVEITKRDQRDKQRSTSPLSVADDAIVVDTTAKSIALLQEKLMYLVHRHMPEACPNR